jgi:hypothetical protein
MKSFPIPVRSIGPGSQPDEDKPLNFLPLPSTMASFAMPQVPERVDPRVRARVRDALAAFQTRWSHWDGAGEAALDLAPLDEAAIDILNEVLGRGEVSIRLRAQRSSHPPFKGRVGVGMGCCAPRPTPAKYASRKPCSPACGACCATTAAAGCAATR